MIDDSAWRIDDPTRTIDDPTWMILGNVSQAIGQPLDEVRQLQADTLRWEAVADEARAFLIGIVSPMPL